jgi:hypothetical protein
MIANSFNDSAEQIPWHPKVSPEMYSGKMPFWDGSMLGFDENNKKKSYATPNFPNIYVLVML